MSKVIAIDEARQMREALRSHPNQLLVGQLSGSLGLPPAKLKPNLDRLQGIIRNGMKEYAEHTSIAELSGFLALEVGRLKQRG